MTITKIDAADVAPEEWSFVADCFVTRADGTLCPITFIRDDDARPPNEITARPKSKPAPATAWTIYRTELERFAAGGPVPSIGYGYGNATANSKKYEPIDIYWRGLPPDARAAMLDIADALERPLVLGREGYRDADGASAEDVLGQVNRRYKQWLAGKVTDDELTAAARAAVEWLANAPRATRPEPPSPQRPALVTGADVIAAEALIVDNVKARVRRSEAVKAEVQEQAMNVLLFPSDRVKKKDLDLAGRVRRAVDRAEKQVRERRKRECRLPSAKNDTHSKKVAA